MSASSPSCGASVGPGLVRADDRVRRVDAARGDVRPVRRPLAQRGQGAADHPGLPGHLDHRVPVAAADRVVAAFLAPVRGDQDRAVGDRSALAAGQAGHRVPAAYCLPGQLPAQPRRPAEYEDLHGLKLSPCSRRNGSVLRVNSSRPGTVGACRGMLGLLHGWSYPVQTAGRRERNRPGSDQSVRKAGESAQPACRRFG